MEASWKKLENNKSSLKLERGIVHNKGSAFVGGMQLQQNKPKKKHWQRHLVDIPLNCRNIESCLNVALHTTIHFNNLLPRYFTTQQQQHQCWVLHSEMRKPPHSFQQSNYRHLSWRKTDKKLLICMIKAFIIVQIWGISALLLIIVYSCSYVSY